MVIFDCDEKPLRTQHALLSNTKRKYNKISYVHTLHVFVVLSTYQRKQSPVTISRKGESNRKFNELSVVNCITSFCSHFVFNDLYSRVAVFSSFFRSFQVLFHHDQFTADLMAIGKKKKIKKKRNDNKPLSCKTTNNNKTIYLWTNIYGNEREDRGGRVH